jgi:hypothetical protein
LLPDPASELMMTGDPGAMVAALVVESAKDEKEVSRKIERTQEEIQDSEEQAQVAAMHAKASDMRAQALASGAAGMVEGALSIAGACNPKDGIRSRAFEASSTLVGTCRKVGDQIGAAHDEDADANVTAHEHAASHASRAYQEAYDDERDAKKLLDTAVDFYREYSNAADQAKAAATHRQ